MRLNFQKTVGLVTMIFCATGIIASLALSIERVNLLKDPNAHLFCSINNAFSCTSVMTSPQAEILNFPNSFLGLIGFSFVFVYGLVLFFFKERQRILDLIFLAGITGAFVFSYWLLFQSVYVIKSLCIYCILSCFSATNIFFAQTLLVLNDRLININDKFNEKIAVFIRKRYYFYVIAIWHIIIASMVYLEFRDKFI